MSVVSRKMRSIPYRSASESWKWIVNLLAPTDSNSASEELSSVSGLSSALISSEAIREAAVVCTGSGPRVRIYCLYDEDAILGDDINESPLQHCPTKGDDWTVSLPCPPEDLDWVERALKKRSSRITARDMAERSGPKKNQEKTSTTGCIIVNKKEFLRP